MMMQFFLKRGYRFCNAKKVSAPQEIKFDFQIPKRPKVSKKESKDSEPKIMRAKRADISEILKPKQQSSAEKIKYQQQHDKEYWQSVENNIKTTNYHYDQYLKGEHLLENIPLDPYYAYKIADFKRKLESKDDEFREFVRPYVDHNAIADKKEKMTELYHEKQQKYELQQYARYLDKYPGSPKGPLPEDDPETYYEYARQNVPKILMDQMLYNAKETEEQKKQTQHIIENGAYIDFKGDGQISDILGGKRELSKQGEIGHINHKEALKQTIGHPIYQNYDSVPEFPQMDFRSYQGWMKDMANWNNFRNYYLEKNGKANLEKTIEYLNEVDRENDPDPQNEWVQIKAAATSLTRYYQTLPMELQKHPAIKDIYLGLEFYSPDMSVAEKEDLLNLAAKMALPTERVTENILKELIRKKKYYMTPFIEEKIRTINPEFTWDIHDFFAEIKRQQLKGTSMIVNEEETFPEPPEKFREYEDHPAELPVNYYDNDDGFWDEIISEKLQKYDSVRPMIKWRKHFTH